MSRTAKRTKRKRSDVKEGSPEKTPGGRDERPHE